MSEARTRQEEELESLRLIYSEEFISTHADAEEAGVTVVQIKLGKSKGEADGEERLVTLRAYLGPEYPLGPEMPLFELRGVNWSRRGQKAVYEGRWVGWGWVGVSTHTRTHEKRPSEDFALTHACRAAGDF